MKLIKKPCHTALFVLCLKQIKVMKRVMIRERRNNMWKQKHDCVLDRGMKMAEEKEKELRRMNRTELIEIIYALKKEEEEAEKKCVELEEKLQERTIRVEQAGSIAEAAMELNQVFIHAQAAADDYLDAVHAAQQEAEQYAGQVKREAKERAEQMKHEAEEEAEKIREQAKTEAEALQQQMETTVQIKMERMRQECQARYEAAEAKQQETENRCRKMIEDVERERKEKWAAFEEKCEAYMKQHQELTALLQYMETHTGGEE